VRRQAGTVVAPCMHCTGMCRCCKVAAGRMASLVLAPGGAVLGNSCVSCVGQAVQLQALQNGQGNRSK
jgi:hypothetical protein